MEIDMKYREITDAEIDEAARKIRVDNTLDFLRARINELEEQNLKLTKKVGDLYKQKKAHMEENRRLWGIMSDDEEKFAETLRKIAYPVKTLEQAQEVAKEALKMFE
jgi:FtsZ-binding cell division protein ZapB